jgi:hypothetical protein
MGEPECDAAESAGGICQLAPRMQRLSPREHEAPRLLAESSHRRSTWAALSTSAASGSGSMNTGTFIGTNPVPLEKSSLHVRLVICIH